MKEENSDKNKLSERKSPLGNGQFESFLEKVSQGMNTANETSTNNRELILPTPAELIATDNIQPSEPPRRKRKPQADYQNVFFVRVDFAHRKPLYITASTHRRLMRIVHLMDSSKATISSYVENILLHHLDMFKEDINTIYQENSTNPTEE